MIILLYGPDTYRARQKLNEIIKHYQKANKSLLNLKYYDAEKNNFQEFLDELQQVPMFKEKKLIVMKNAFQSAEFKEEIRKHLKNLAKSGHIIVFFEESDIKGKITEGKAQKFDFLAGPALRKWIKSEFDKFDSKPDLEAIEKLIEFAGSDSWRISNEIKKLASYAKSRDIPPFAETASHLPKRSEGREMNEVQRTPPRPASQVSVKDVELLVRPQIETDIFKTIDAVAERNKKRALELLKKHLQKGEPPLYLLSMINYQFRNLLLVKSGGAFKLKLHPYVARKAAEQARRFSFEELKKIYRKIFEADLNIKTGKLEPEAALDLLISEI